MHSIRTELSNEDKEPKLEDTTLHGISVIIPSYAGKDRIETAMESLRNQTLEPNRFEIIVIVNGKEDGTTELLQTYSIQNPDLQIRVLFQEKASAGAARNLGVQVARFSRITFLDDDDYVQSRFLEIALENVDADRVVLMPILDSTDGLNLDDSSSLSNRIRSLAGKSVRLADASWALGFNACKVVETSQLRGFKYHEDLKSGEDLVYFAELLNVDGLEFYVPAELDDAAYVRILSQNSISRRTEGISFNVAERLAVIRALEEIDVEPKSTASRAINELKSSQAGFIQRYLKKYPGERVQVQREIVKSGVQEFPWTLINGDAADNISFLYCFAPYFDTSAIVASKRLAEFNLRTDVISNDMGAVRREDSGVTRIAAPWVNNHVEIDAPASFSGWQQIATFGTRAANAADELRAGREPYKNVYSRAVWIGSHVAAALYKLRYPRVSWSAEYSDPLRRGTTGDERSGNFESEYVSNRLINALKSRGIATDEVKTVFDLVELSSFVLADRLIFTNVNQMEYMLSLYTNRDLIAHVRSKSIIMPHPTPDESLYEVRDIETGVVPEAVINIGYFGAFYPNRGISDVLVAIANLPLDVRKRIRLHVHTNKQKDVEQYCAQLGITPNIYVGGYYPYLEFLAATKKFDVLLVNDTETSGYLPTNPFLPSKYADYLGSGVDIWAVSEDGSPLSAVEGVRYRSRLMDSPDIRKTLMQIVSDKADSEIADQAVKFAREKE